MGAKPLEGKSPKLFSRAPTRTEVFERGGVVVGWGFGAGSALTRGSGSKSSLCHVNVMKERIYNALNVMRPACVWRRPLRWQKAVEEEEGLLTAYNK